MRSVLAGPGLASETPDGIAMEKAALLCLETWRPGAERGRAAGRGGQPPGMLGSVGRVPMAPEHEFV